MQHTKEEQLDIGRQIYNNELTRYQAAELYDISVSTARSYMRKYRDINQLPAKSRVPNIKAPPRVKSEITGLEDIESMSKEQLIHELLKAKITEARLKKGYEVKGDGSVILYGNKNIK